MIKSYPILVGKNADGNVLSHEVCEKILSLEETEWTQNGKETPYWLKGSAKPCELDKCVDIDRIIREEKQSLTPMQQEEVERLKQTATVKKNRLSHTLDDLNAQLKELTAEKESVKSDRLKLLIVDRKISLLNNDISKKKEGLFFDEMRIDVETEEQINKFLDREKITAKAVRQFVVEVIHYA